MLLEVQYQLPLDFTAVTVGEEAVTQGSPFHTLLSRSPGDSSRGA